MITRASEPPMNLLRSIYLRNTCAFTAIWVLRFVEIFRYFGGYGRLFGRLGREMIQKGS